PVTQTTSTISWPEGGTLDPVTAPLVAYYPLDLTVEVPCTAVQELRDQGAEDGVLVSTAPKEAGENAGARALTVSVAGPTVEVRSRNVLIASAPTDAVAAPDACSTIRITADSASIGAEFEGRGGPRARVPRPQGGGRDRGRSRPHGQRRRPHGRGAQQERPHRVGPDGRRRRAGCLQHDPDHGRLRLDRRRVRGARGRRRGGRR